MRNYFFKEFRPAKLFCTPRDVHRPLPPPPGSNIRQQQEPPTIYDRSTSGTYRHSEKKLAVLLDLERTPVTFAPRLCSRVPFFPLSSGSALQNPRVSRGQIGTRLSANISQNNAREFNVHYAAVAFLLRACTKKLLPINGKRGTHSFLRRASSL